MTPSRVWVLKGCLAGLGLVATGLKPTLAFAVAEAASPAETRVPAIKQVAILPVHWQGKFPEGPSASALQKQIDQNFTRLVQASRRFAFTNDVITADLWSSPEGRKELVEEYEIDAMLSLSVTSQNDLMSWTVRLLSPTLQTYLSETERVPFQWALVASPSELDQRMQNLLFRLLNRYPIDVFVTSVQGRYVSLSSGQAQGIFEGDELSFYETKLKSQHPIDGSWLNFQQKLLGKAKVVESQQQSAIALITSLSFENAITVGDGARVVATATRRNFQQTPAEAQRYVPVSKDSAIVMAPGDLPASPAAEPPQAVTPPPIKPKAAPQPEPQGGPRTAEVSASPPKAMPQESPEIPLADEEKAPSALPMGGNGDSEPAIGDWIAATFSDTFVGGGIEGLSFRGSNKLTSTLPSWLVNRLSAKAYQDLAPEYVAIYGTALRLGDSKKGDYIGLDAEAEGLYKINTLSAQIPSLNHVLIGGIARIATLGVNGENFGGWNSGFVGPSLHLQGSHHLAEQVQTVDYDFAFRYFIAAMGSAGISGKKRSLEKGSAWEVELNAIARGKPEDWEWGAQAVAHQGEWDLSKGSLEQQSWVLGLVGRRRF